MARDVLITPASGLVDFLDSSVSKASMTLGTDGILTLTGGANPIVFKTSTSGSSILRADGTSGTVFEITDDLSNSLMSVNTIAGLPVLEVFADNHIVAGRYGQNDFYLNTDGSLGLGTSSPSSVLDIYEQSGKDNKLRFHSSTTGSGTSNGSRIGLNGAELFINNIENAAIKIYTQSTQTNGITILGDGNVGIGRTGPSNILDILKNQSAATYVNITNTTNNASSQVGVKIDSNSANNYILAHADLRTVTRYGIAIGGYGEILSSTGNGLLIGTASNNKPIVFGNNNLERLRIDVDGNVGIGTPSPNHELEVSGGGDATIRITSTSTNIGDNYRIGTLQYFSSDTSSNTVVGEIVSRTPVGNFGTVFDMAFSTYKVNSGALSEKMRITGAGNVGIGTTIPGDLVHIRKDQDSETALYLQNNNDAAGAGTTLRLGVGGPNSSGDVRVAMNVGNGGSDWALGIDNSDNDKFKISGGTDNNNTDLGTNTRLTIDGSGNVGIGTTSPAYTLQVQGTGYFSSNLLSSGLTVQTNSNYIRESSDQIRYLSRINGRNINHNAQFISGTTSGYGLYNNSGGSATSISVIYYTSDTAISTSAIPNSVGNVLKISYTSGVGSTSPGFGGFYLGTTNSETISADQKYKHKNRIIHRIWAKIPSGKTLAFASNAYGTNGSFTWLTPTGGNGDWYEYIGVQQIGYGGSFSSSSYFYVSGGSNASFNWYVAECSLIDVDCPSDILYSPGLSIGYSRGSCYNSVQAGWGSLGVKNDAIIGGSVGIGTTNPAESLTVIGDVLIDNGGDSTLYLGKGAEGIDGVTKIKSVQTGADTDQLGIAFNVHPSVAGSAVSVEAMRVDHSGNVGIKNTVSQAYTNEGTRTVKLRVGSDTLTSNQSSALQIGGHDSSGSATLGAIEFFNHRDDSIIAKMQARRDLESSGKLSAGQLDFYTDDGDNNLNLQMSIDALGRVGIGTGSPASLLHIQHSGTTTDQALFIHNTNNANDAGIKFSDNTTATQNGIFYYSHSDAASNGTENSFHFNSDQTNLAVIIDQTNANSGYYIGESSPVVAIRGGGDSFFNGGDVGIGTDSPAALIHGMSGDLFLTANSTSANSGQGIYFQSTTSGWATNSAHAAIFGKRVDASNGYLRFDTRSGGNTAERMRIDSAGNVGIGTTDPNQLLDIDGITRIRRAGTVTTEYLDIEVTDSVATFSISQDESAHGGFYFLLDDNSGSSINSAFRISNSTPIDLLTVRSDGKVGIGTTTPDVKLEVIASPADGIIADFVNGTNAGGTTAAIKLSNADSEACDVVLGANRVDANFGSDFFISLSDNVDGTNQERFRITEAGNVGIGTNNPTEKLEITGNVRVMPSSGDAKIRLTDSGVRNWDLRVSDGSDYFEIDGTSSTSLVVTGAGNVGIGTISPSQKLHVVGKALITDDLQLTGSNPRIDFNTNGASSLRFYDTTNAAERMRINTSGNLGINTTSPTSKLQIVGSTSGDSVLKVDGTNGTLFEVVDDLSDSLMSVNDAAGLPVFEVFADNHIVAGRYNQNDFYLNTNGNLGLGTSSPITKLNIKGDQSADGQLYIEPTNDGEYAGLVIKTTRGADRAYAIFAGGTGTDDLNFRFRDATAGADRMVIDSSGKVGIGTTSPAEKLHIGSGASETTNSFVRVDGNASKQKGFNIYGDGTEQWRIYTSSSNSDLRFYDGSNVTVTFEDGGNVGIGTGTPSQKLHVQGSLRLTAAFYDSNNATGTSGQVLTSTGSATDWKDLDQIATTPNAPASASATIVGETVDVTFAASTTSNIDAYLVYSSIDGSDYGLISVIPPEDFSSSMSVIDNSFDETGTQAYRVYAMKLGVLSSAATASVSYTVSSAEPTSMNVVDLNNAFYVQWNPPSSNERFVTAYNVYKDENASQGSLNRSNATLIYSGLNTNYMYQINGTNNNNFHQFWVETTIA